MHNHYHLVVRTPEPNLSDAVRWLQVSYSGRFNRAHRQVGPVFAGRFRAVLRNYPWSSWRVYCGAEPKAAWLETRVVLAACGGRGAAAQRTALR
jgi:hypothetical protein